MGDKIVLSKCPEYVVGTAPAGVPQNCPITGLKFFSMERNPDGKGYVPTYGGPFDSYTVPEPDEDSETGYAWRTYDHDAGGWDDSWEDVPAQLLKREAEK